MTWYCNDEYCTDAVYNSYVSTNKNWDKSILILWCYLLIFWFISTIILDYLNNVIKQSNQSLVKIEIIYNSDYEESDDNESNSDDESTHNENNKTLVKWPYHKTEKIPVDLGNRMKYYEQLSSTVNKIEPEFPFIVRIDGNNFSSFTHKLKNLYKHVFVKEFQNAMIETCNDLLLKFRPSTAYTHSDEITLIFSPNKLENGTYTQHPYGGRVDKLISLISSSASTSFTKNLMKYKMYVESVDQIEKVVNSTSIAFDGRIIVFPIENTYEILNHMIWRTRDANRNYISTYADKYIGKHNTFGMSNITKLEKLKTEHKFDLNDTELSPNQLCEKHGVFLKICHNKTHDKTHTSNTHTFSSNSLKFSKNLLEFMLKKYKCKFDSFDKCIVDSFDTVMSLDELVLQ